VTISLGAARVFRLWPAHLWPAQKPPADRGHVDFAATHAAVFVLPWDTNKAVKHGVPHRASDTGRRISITLRAFAA
jgi:hypothetical protein